MINEQRERPAMKPKAFFLAAVFALILSGCGGDHGPSLIVSDIVSEGGTNDGDITLSGGVYSVFTSNQSPFTIQVEYATVSETRGFMTFSLATIPVNASIQRATVFLPILQAVPAGSNTSVALFPDMVSFPPLDPFWTQTAMGNVFDTATILIGPSFNVSPGDVGSDKTFDATDAVIKANSLALSSLQIRLLAGSGFVEIDDLLVPATGAGTPLLRVEYF